MTAEGRMACLVPFCRCTVGKAKGYLEWICGKHWKLVSPTLKRRKRWVQRRMQNPKFFVGRERVYIRLYNAIWTRCKEQATGRAMGCG